MDMKREIPNAALLAEAEHWFSRVRSEDCTASERMAFQRWHADPRHAAAYARTEALWEQAGSARQLPEMQRLMQEVLAETEPAPARSGWRLPLALAASIGVAAIALGAVLLRDDSTEVYRTALGERRTVTLADGSSVTLNTETRLEVRYSEQLRELKLDHGEALFEVSHDAARPFLVSAGGGSVTALGTRFQVRRNDEQVQVVLLEGRVAVARSEVGDRVVMAPGEQVSYAGPEKKMVRRTVDPDAALSWTSGRLVFRATPLSEAVSEINRYARTKIRLADASLSELRISGTFVTGDSELLARALETDMPVRADFSASREIVLYQR